MLGKADVPTLYLRGIEDGFGGEDSAKRTSGAMPRAELVMMPNAGHLPWLDEPKWVAEQTAAFLTRQT